MTSPSDPNDNFYTERELAEIEELNQLTDGHESFFQNRWWRRIAIGASVLIAASLILPFVLQFRGEPAAKPEARMPVPDFELAAAAGGNVRLSDALKRHDSVVLVFYRGYF